MNDFFISKNIFNEDLYWINPIPNNDIDEKYIKSIDCVKYFDQNGYDLTPIEQEYAKYNCEIDLTLYKNIRSCIYKPWFLQNNKFEGYVLNHSMLLERKGYYNKALDQLQSFALMNPLLYKLINYKTKWGVDLSIDYVDVNGNVMELLHYEYDSFNLNKIKEIKNNVENKILNSNLDFISLDLLSKKNEWYNLEFFEQSKYKTDYFNLEPERFKIVAWK